LKFDVNIQPAEQADLPIRLQTVFDHWVELKGENWAPGWPAFRLLDLPSDVIPFMIVLDVKRDPLDFVYRFWGTANTTYIGYDCTGMSVHDNKLFGPKVFNECTQIVEERRGYVYKSKVTRDDGLYREYTRMRLPLSGDADGVSHIISVVDIKDMRADPFAADFG
jgi:hypothetical protein